MDLNIKKLPPVFLKTVEEIIPKDKLSEIYKGLCSSRPTTFRTNTLKNSSKELESELEKLGFEIERVKWLPDAFILMNKSKRELVDSDPYLEGKLYVQSLSSQIPSFILEPSENDLICDLTAAPGSKTTQIAAMMKNNGKIIANDMSRVRSEKLKANLKIQGVTNVEVSYGNGQDLWKKYPEYFDKTLLDAPCSLEGRFNCNDEKTYRDWTPKKVKILSQYQKFLLRSAVSLTRVEGTIVYSTCTLSPEENEEVVEWILKKAGDAIEIEEISMEIPEALPGLAEFKGKKFNEGIKKAIRILPSESMEGFFVIKLKKVKSTI